MSGGDAKVRLVSACGAACGDGSAPARAAAKPAVLPPKTRGRRNRSASPAASEGGSASDSSSSGQSDEHARAHEAAHQSAPRRRRARAMRKGKQAISKTIDVGYRLMVRRRAMEAAELAARRAYVDTFYAYGLASQDPAPLVCRVQGV